MSTKNISAVFFDTGKKLEEKTSPLDSYIQIIDGKADIIIPTHRRNSIKKKAY